MGLFSRAWASWKREMVATKKGTAKQRSEAEGRLKKAFDDLVRGLGDDANWDDDDEKAFEEHRKVAGE